MMKKTLSCFTIIGIMIFSLSLPVSGLTEQDVSIGILAVSPRLIQGDDSGLPGRRSTGLDIVGIGENCYLIGIISESDETVASMDWAFAVRPDGSQAAFRTAGQYKTAFAPDVEGEYTVQLTVTGQDAAAPVVKTIRILAASYVGVGGMNNDNPQFPQCALCHPAVTALWRDTRHANVLARHLNGERSGPYDTSCFECHTTGFDKDFQAANGGFHTAVQQENVDLQEIVDSINQASQLNHDNDPNNDVAYYDSLLPSLRDKANVQCENCHGPGSQHLGNVNNIGKAWDARVCAQCHDSQGFDGHPYPFDSSAHKTLPALFQENPILLNTECALCHSAAGFEQLVDKGYDAPPPAISETHGVSCVACHDPHDKTVPQQLRIMEDVLLKSGHDFDNGGKGSICVLCHQSRVSSDLEKYIKTDTGGPHFSPQADVLLGVNAWTFGDETKDRTSVHKVLLQDTCVTCHMAEIPENGWDVESGILLGGHSFKITNSMGTADGSDDLSNHKNSCLPCHLTMTSVNRVLHSGQDYDGNGRVDGIQTEVRGLLLRLAERLKERFPTIEVKDDLTLKIPSTLYNRFSFPEKAAIYNYRLFLRDGSFGVHNGRFAIEILQKSYSALTLRTLKLDYPNAYMVGTSSINEWSEYKK